MPGTEITREQILQNISYYLNQMTDSDLLMVLGFSRGIVKESQS